MKNKVESVRYYLKKSGINSSNSDILEAIQGNPDLPPKEVADILVTQNSSAVAKKEQGIVHQSGDRAVTQSSLTTVEKTENLVARAAEKLDLTLTREEVKDLASEFTNGYSIAVEDGERVLKLLRDWILHQERLAAIQLERLQNQLEDTVAESHARTHKRVKGLLATSKERQSDYLDRHKKEMDAIYHFFGELMPKVDL